MEYTFTPSNVLVYPSVPVCLAAQLFLVCVRNKAILACIKYQNLELIRKIYQYSLAGQLKRNELHSLGSSWALMKHLNPASMNSSRSICEKLREKNKYILFFYTELVTYIILYNQVWDLL